MLAADSGTGCELVPHARYGLPPDNIPAELNTSYPEDHARSYPIKSAVQVCMLPVCLPQ